MVNYMAPRKRIGLSFKSQNLLKLVFISVHCLFLFVVTFLLYFSIASPFCWLGKWLEPSPPLSWAFSRFRFFFCTHKYKPLLKQILLGKAGQIWKLETMWNLQSYYLQFPWSGHSCLSPTSPGTSATGENHQHKSAISIKTFCKLYFSLKCSSISVFTNYISC